MFAEGEDGPCYVPINALVVKLAASQWSENRDSLNGYLQRGRTHVLLGQDPETGDYIILRPREKENMEKSTFWGIRNAKEKLKSVYMDLEEMPNEASEIKVMVKRLEEIEKIVDEAVNA